MINIITSYRQLLTLLVDYFHKSSQGVDPVLINKARFYSRALSIAFWYVNKPGLSIREVGLILKDKFGKSNLLSCLIETAPSEVLNLFDEIKQPIRQDCNLGDVYEQLLSIETSGLEVKSGKEYRNKLGSYYTPSEYAEEITRMAFVEYLKNHTVSDLTKARIVDFSCGCGAFLLASLKQCEQIGLDKDDLRASIHNIYACDVDPLALEIAKISILDYCKAAHLYKEISVNFRHANFLIHTDIEASSKDRLMAAMCGYIYHETLALGVNFLQQYDIILGNPPWEKIRFEEKKFFSQFIEGVYQINFKFNLGQSIAESLKDNPMMQKYVETYKHQLESVKQQIKNNAFFKDSVIGELNTCALFADSAYNLLRQSGSAGLFVKSSLFTSKVNKTLFAKLKNRAVAIYDFINRNKIFDIDSRERFGILLLGKNNGDIIRLGMNLLTISDIQSKAEEVRYSIINILNPETKMIPNLNSGRDLTILSSLYSSFNIFSKVFPDAKFGRLVHLTNHIKYIDKVPNKNNLPILEGKFFSIFDNAYSGFNGVSEEDRYKSKATSRKFTPEEKASGIQPLSRFFINKDKWEELSKQYNSEYMLAWHSLTSATNLRSCVATLLPFSPGSQSVQFLTLTNDEDLIYLAGIFNSVVFDYIVKCKLNGIDLTQAVITQLPIPSIEGGKKLIIELRGIKASALEWIKLLVKSFYANDFNLSALFTKVNGTKLDGISREELFVMLEVVVAKLYQLDNVQFEYILSLFGKFYSAETRRQIMKDYDTLT